MKRMVVTNSILIGACVIAGCVLNSPALYPPLDVVDSVDLNRYTGKWYEIAKYPNFFQAGCENATAEYGLRDDGKISVINTCQAENGERTRSIEGYAEVDDAETNAKLKVYFGNSPFGGSYWIIELDEDYQYAVVGEPSRSTLWILSRTPTMDAATYADILARLPDKGYDPERLELSSAMSVSE